MNYLIIIFILTFTGNIVFAQTEKDSIDQIRTHFKWINEQTDFVIAELNNKDFLEHTPDNGAQLKGYYKNDTLYKLIERTGLSYAIMTTEYYLWNNELIFVYDTEQNYKQEIDSVDGFLGFDYSDAEVKYESRHYFVDGKEIQKLEKGKRLMELSQARNFSSTLLSYQPLLKNKKDNQIEYDQIQGRWTSTIDSLSIIEFSGLTKIDYYEGRYIDHSRIKIENDFLFCWTQKENDEYKYEIMSLTDNYLTLLYLPAGRLLTFEKRKRF